MNNLSSYDIAIVGGGISSSVFASRHIKNGFKGKIAIIEYGRNLGGRASTRYSFSNKGWQLDHGSPNLNIKNYSNNLTKKFIRELLDKDIIQSDTSEYYEFNDENNLNLKVNSDFHSGKNYITSSTMSELSQKIISTHNINNQIDYFFETLIVKLEFRNNKWILTSKNGSKFISKFLVCSSNLLLHKRSLDILHVNQIPLRKAIPIKKDKIIDNIIKLLDEQSYLPRMTFLIYTNHNYDFKDSYKKKYRYFLLNKSHEQKFKIERIIFQKHIDSKLGIVIHTRSVDLIKEFSNSENHEIFKANLILQFNKLFHQNKHINKLFDYKDISIMRWNASQPYGAGIPENLQVCKKYNIAFCGDWFANEGFGRVEGAILSALKLSEKLI